MNQTTWSDKVKGKFSKRLCNFRVEFINSAVRGSLQGGAISGRPKSTMYLRGIAVVHKKPYFNNLFFPYNLSKHKFSWFSRGLNQFTNFHVLSLWVYTAEIKKNWVELTLLQRKEDRKIKVREFDEHLMKMYCLIKPKLTLQF